MLVPLNFENNANVALSIIKNESNDQYSVKACTIVNGYGLERLPSYCANRKPEDSPIGTIESIPMFDLNISYTGTDLMECINQVLKELEKRYN